MLRVLIASADIHSSQQLRASLEQTGLVTDVLEWKVTGESFPQAGEILSDVILLDLGRDPDPYFALARHVRGLQPAVRIIACSTRCGAGCRNFSPSRYLRKPSGRRSIASSPRRRFRKSGARTASLPSSAPRAAWAPPRW